MGPDGVVPGPPQGGPVPRERVHLPLVVRVRCGDGQVLQEVVTGARVRTSLRVVDDVRALGPPVRMGEGRWRGGGGQGVASGVREEITRYVG